MFVRITSRKHAQVGTFRSAAAGAVEGRMLVEGPRLVEEALISGLTPASFLLREDKLEILSELAAQLAARGAAGALVTNEVLEAACEVKTPQPIAALFATPQFDSAQIISPTGPPLVLVACGIQQPGNLGAIMRAGEAFGASGLLSLLSSARLHRPAVLRGAMGSLFRLPAIEGLSPNAALAMLRSRPLRLISFELAGACDLADAPFEEPCALLLGSEAHGVPPELSQAADLRVRIPMAPVIDSLGVAAASAVALYEAARRRGALHTKR